MNKTRRWTDEENLFLKKFYPTKGNKYVADKLGRTRSSVAHRALKLGLTAIGSLPFRYYSPQEIIFIKKYYPLKGTEYVAKKLGRSATAIKNKALDLRVERKSLFEWSTEEIEYLKKWYGKKRPSEIAHRIERTTNAVLIKARTLGLFKRFVRMWTKDEELFLIKNFRRMIYKQIGKHLNRTERSVSKKVNHSKLIKKIERNWTPKERRLLSRLYGKVPAYEIAVRLNRTTTAVRAIAHIKKKTKKAPPRYSEKEKNFIRNNYLKKTNVQIAKKLRRTTSAIAGIANDLNLTGNDKKRDLWIRGNVETHYTEKEKEFIRKNYLKMTNIEIGRNLNRPAGGIKSVAARLGINSSPQKRQLWKRGNPESFYTEEEKKFILDNYLKMTNEQIADKLKRSRSGIAGMLRKLRLTGNHNRKRGNMKRFYTEKEKNIIRENYSKMTYAQIAVELGRSFQGIAGMVRKLGLAGNYKRTK